MVSLIFSQHSLIFGTVLYAFCNHGFLGWVYGMILQTKLLMTIWPQASCILLKLNSRFGLYCIFTLVQLAPKWVCIPIPMGPLWKQKITVIVTATTSDFHGLPCFFTQSVLWLVNVEIVNAWEKCKAICKWCPCQGATPLWFYTAVQVLGTGPRRQRRTL